MKTGKDISAQYKDLYIVHHNMPGKKASDLSFKEHILFIPLQGTITITTADKKQSACPGEMIYLAPGIFHSFSSNAQGGERLIVMFHSRIIKKIAAHNACLKLPINHLIKEIIFYLLLHPNTKNLNSLIRVFLETLSEILKCTPSNDLLDHRIGNVTDPRLKRFLELMQESIGERIPIGETAKKSGLSARNLNRLLLKETGMQARQWQIHLRIEHAKELLKKTGASVTKVATDVGYNSLSHFITAFRSHTGQLPSDFLRRS